jgi:hypothetical protein
MVDMVCELNGTYTVVPALYSRECDPGNDRSNCRPQPSDKISSPDMNQPDEFKTVEIIPPISRSTFVENGFTGITWLEIELMDGRKGRALWNGKTFEVEICGESVLQPKSKIFRWREMSGLV